MKRLFRIACAVFAAAALSMGVTAAAVNDVVDMSDSTHGYVTVNLLLECKAQGWYSVQRRQDCIL